MVFNTGGIKGLLYIDALQILLVVGTGLVALVLVYVSMTPDLSFGQIWDSLVHGQVKIAGQWEPGNKLQVVDASWRFDLPYNLVGALLAATVFKVAQFSTDQEFVQRQLTCRDVRKAGSSLVASQVISLPIVLVFLSIGLLLFSKYSQTDPAAFAQYQGDARDLFPQYICHCIPAGLRGLMMVGLLAAALSSFNSAINSMASSFTADLYLPIRRQRGRALETDSAQMASSKKMTVFMGLALTGFAIFTAVLQSMSGMNLVDFATGVMCFSYAGMLGVFLTALFTRRGNARSVVAALIAGLLVAFFLMTAKSLFGLNLTHAYKSVYSVGSYTLPSIPTVSINETFSPLIGVDATFMNDLTAKVEYRTSRVINLSMTSVQVNEALSRDWEAGFAYKIRDFNIFGTKGNRQIKKAQNPRKKSKSGDTASTPSNTPSTRTGVNHDLNMRLDITFRKQAAITRDIATATSSASSGNSAFKFAFMADYTLSKLLTLTAYYEQQTNTPLLASSSYPTTTYDFGLSLKFSLTR